MTQASMTGQGKKRTPCATGGRACPYQQAGLPYQQAGLPYQQAGLPYRQAGPGPPPDRGFRRRTCFSRITHFDSGGEL
jgi:hypothetical protein